MFFSCRGVKLGDLSKPTARAYFFGVKLMFVGVMNLGQIQKIRFVDGHVPMIRFTAVNFLGHIPTNSRSS